MDTPTDSVATARYERLKAMYGARALSRLHEKEVGVIGVGALGSQLLPHLAMLGLQMVLVDDGVVEPVNLGNQGFDVRHVGGWKVVARQETIARINPGCRVESLPVRLEQLGFGALRNVDLIFCCLDSLGSRLWLNELCVRLSIPWVDAAVDGSGTMMYGKVASYSGTGDGACFVCSWDAKQLDETSHRGNEPCPSWWTIGDEESLPTLTSSPVSGVIAGLQCIEGLKQLLADEPADLSTETIVNIDSGCMQRLALKRNDTCLMPHEPFGNIVAAGKGDGLSVGQTFHLAEKLVGPGATLCLPKKALVSRLHCVRCGRENEIGKLDLNLSQQDATCPCGHLTAPTPLSLLSEFGQEDVTPFLESTWSAIGLPQSDVIIAKANGRHASLLIE